MKAVLATVNKLVGIVVEVPSANVISTASEEGLSNKDSESELEGWGVEVVGSVVGEGIEEGVGKV